MGLPIPVVTPSRATAEACGYRLRAVEPRDTPAVFAVFSQPACRHAMDMEPFGSEAALERWLRETGTGNYQSVATLDDAAVAFAGLYLDRDAARRTGWISLFVHDAHHGRGIGTLIMTALVATAHVLGVGAIKLNVFCDNHGAIALYRKFGFRIEARDDTYLHRDGQDVAAFTMIRTARPETARQTAVEQLCRTVQNRDGAPASV